jgi:hypothetical protein
VQTQFLQQSDDLARTGDFSPLSRFADSNKLPDSPAFAATAAFTSSVVFDASAAFSESSVFSSSLSFPKSSIFAETKALFPTSHFSASVAFSFSSTFTLSATFGPSAPFTPSAPLVRPIRSVVVPIVPNVAEQISNGLGSGASIGVGLGGLAAIAALLLLLFLLKRRKKQIPDEAGEMIDERTVDTLTEHDEYISEYGLSNDMGPMEDDEGGEDLPHSMGDDGMYASGVENASEHNPDELEGEFCDPDEG